MLIITWDPPKRLTNFKLRKLDFAIVTPDFFETAVILPGKADRFLAIGRIAGRPYTVVFKPLGAEAVSVISLRIASTKERRLL